MVSGLVPPTKQHQPQQEMSLGSYWNEHGFWLTVYVDASLYEWASFWKAQPSWYELHVCMCAPTIITGSLLFDCSGYSPCSRFPEWVTPAFSGPLHWQRRVLLQRQTALKGISVQIIYLYRIWAKGWMCLIVYKRALTAQISPGSRPDS